jgi:hypothetical protein
MHKKSRWGWALALLALAGCGDDSASGEPTTQNEGPATSGCRSGQYPGGAGTLTLCGPDTKSGDSCTPIEKFRGHTKYAGDIAIYPGTLPDLTALSCLSELGRLSVGQSAELTDLRGLDNVSKASAVELLGNKKLTSLTGLGKLRSVVQITINKNDSLTDIVGLADGFTTGSLYVAINGNLTSLDGLKGIKVMRTIAIEDNFKLSSCAVDDFGGAYPGVELINDGNLKDTCP